MFEHSSSSHPLHSALSASFQNGLLHHQEKNTRWRRVRVPPGSSYEKIEFLMATPLNKCNKRTSLSSGWTSTDHLRGYFKLPIKRLRNLFSCPLLPVLPRPPSLSLCTAAHVGGNYFYYFYQTGECKHILFLSAHIWWTHPPTPRPPHFKRPCLMDVNECG